MRRALSAMSTPPAPSRLVERLRAHVLAVAPEDPLTDAHAAEREHAELQMIMRHRDVNCKSLGDQLQSVNFADRAFYKARWDDMSIQARGLFVETAYHAAAKRSLLRVCGRSYRKFFYQDERGVTYMQRDQLPALIHFPMTAYVKENGYLGILFARRGPSGEAVLQPASKSTIQGDFAGMFAHMLQRHLDAHHVDPGELARVLADANVSLVFEVIHPTFDPHIIRYKEPQMVLLDCISNRVSAFVTQPYNVLREIGDAYGFRVKSPAGTVANMDEYDRLHQRLTQDENFRVDGQLVEGLVLEDAHKFMIKVKSIYYNNWKRVRTLKDVIRRGRAVKLHADEHPTVARAVRWLQQPQNRKMLDQDVITLRAVFLGEMDEDAAIAQAPPQRRRHNSDEAGEGEGEGAGEPAGTAGPADGPAIDAASPLGQKLAQLTRQLSEKPTCVVVVGPPHASQDKLVDLLAARVGGAVVRLDKNVKSTIASAYYSGKPTFVSANEVVLLKLWPTVAAAAETLSFRFVCAVIEPSDELPLVCIKNAAAADDPTPLASPEHKGKAPAVELPPAKRDQGMHHAILRSCKRLETALDYASRPPSEQTDAMFRESGLAAWLVQAFPDGFARVQLLPESVKRITNETEAAIGAAELLAAVDVRDEIVNSVLGPRELLEAACDAILQRLAASPAAADGRLSAVRAGFVVQLVRDAVFHGRVPSIQRLQTDDERRFAMWLTIAGLHQNELLRRLGPTELYKAYGSTAPPASPPTAPVLLLLVGLPGLGKSHVSSILSRTFGIRRVCQDEEGNRDKFLRALLAQLKSAGIVFADRNNHTASHRHAVIEAVKKKAPTAVVVCISFQVGDMHDTVRLCAERIQGRGEAHPSLRASSEYDKVLAMFSKSYQAPVLCRRAPGEAPQWPLPMADDDWDYVIDHLIEIDPRQDEAVKVHQLVEQLHAAIGNNTHALDLRDLPAALAAVQTHMRNDASKAGPAEDVEALAASLASSSMSPSASRSPSLSPAASPFVSPAGKRIPQYYAFQLQPDDVPRIREAVGRLPGVRALESYANQRPMQLNGAPHVTLLFLGGRSLLSEHDEALFGRLVVGEGAELTLSATHVLQNDKGVCLAVSVPDEYRDERRREQAGARPGAPTHHITLATATGVAPRYSNDMVDSAFFADGNPEGVDVRPLEPPLALRARLRGLWQ
eukprot:Unigene9078_Nuclearia_a/m.27759 Unigene9078_Nuclearia_a/g.27759  ORF Unigene9078_Nuclearia_a/g.27759 Unigene9078_Nuclearia_a/m.27759 type:complete len:1188 (-) Unigene9078_Nuclearia_a:60-3623(-)